jgi:hypothetical protein
MQLEELRWRAVSFFKDRGTFWKKFGCSLFAKYNHYSSFELSEFEAPEWVPISLQADPDLIRRVCIEYLYKNSGFEFEEVLKTATLIGAELTNRWSFHMEVKATYLVLTGVSFSKIIYVELNFD